MSLISQNAGTKRGKTAKDTEEDEPAFMGGGEDGDMKMETELAVKKRRKERNNEQAVIEDDKKRKNLENLLFGSIYSPVEFGKEEEEEVVNRDGSALFFVDRSANSELPEDDAEFSDEDEENEGGVANERKAVWVDDEEEATKIDISKVNRLRKLRKEEEESVISGSEYVSRLRVHHSKLNPGTEWARLDSHQRDYGRGSSDESSDEEQNDNVAPVRGYVEGVDEILRSNEDLVVKSRVKLLPGLLEYSKLVDANAQDPSSGPINSVEFHRNSQLLLTAGLDKKIRFFQIDGKRNTKIQSIFIDDCPIRKASFLPDGSQVIISGRRKFFYSFDLVNAKVDKIGPLVGREEKSLELFEVSPDSKIIAFVGNEGYILLVSTKTKELIGTLKMNGTARSLAFSADGKQLITHGGDGQIYHWDLRTRTCIHKSVDEGCINGTSLSTSPLGNFFAAGSDSGIVNVYNREEFLGGKRKPVKTIENLTTKVDFMKFNDDAQILAICSTMGKNAMKLIHVPSFTAFSNWPPPNQTIHYPRCLDFSPGGGFMAVGNAAGKVLLYKLHHYHHA
ncbi:U3 small nucleolar RNA-associated protein 18 homolog [Linum perenne]